MRVTAVVGAQWGDEGKGKIIDELAAQVDYVVRYQGGGNAGHRVVYDGGELPSTVLVRTSERRLYLVLSDGKAIRYPVGVGKYGDQWQGRAKIDGKHVEPAWSPPAEVKHDSPGVPGVIPGGTPGNPMGARALTLSGGGQYAIHGTNRPESIGNFVSYGCIRMFNEDIIDLFERVSVGTEVVVTR